ncbi:MAG: glycosyltransferase family protein [bacterium]|nr:glycosyltransferase family protein [bacterium]
MNEHKFCFIICTNNELQLEECILYIKLLHVPEGYQTELLTIRNAVSMTSGYNEGMRASDAKYKIYLHQDSFIVEPFFLDKLLQLFQQDKSIGMIGTLGTEHLSPDGIMWHEDRCGDAYLLDQHGGSHINQFTQGYREVEALDGLLMATQYDLPWREDIFQDWHFYDVSQCMEFRRSGYKVIVPGQEKNWVIHSCGICSLLHYEDDRRLLLQTYPEICG